MKFIKNKLFLLILFVIILVGYVVINQYLIVQKAHSTFENYYAFRGCVSLVKKTSDYGICKLSSGLQIKIVKYQNKWYLDGDLPGRIF
jgi:Na+/H+ antiporter NhaC